MPAADPAAADRPAGSIAASGLRQAGREFYGSSGLPSACSAKDIYIDSIIAHIVNSFFRFVKGAKGDCRHPCGRKFYCLQFIYNCSPPFCRKMPGAYWKKRRKYAIMKQTKR